MTAALLPLLVAVPLLAAGLLVLAGHRRRTHAVVVMAVLVGSTAAGVTLVVEAAGGAVIAHGLAGWPVGIAIPFVADMLSALMLTVTGVLAVACVTFALAAGHASSQFFAPLVLVLTAGVNGAWLTADLFNLFVFIEVMLLPSYGLFVLTSQSRAPLHQIAGTRLYVALNLLTSTIFLAGVGFVYGTAGTVNLAELAAAASTDDSVAVAAAVCLLALGIKAAVVPVHGWLARSYPSTSPAVTALFSGLHTKVAIYAVYRIYAVVFDGDGRWLGIGVVVFSATMVIGVLGAVGETTTRSILAFHMVSQIGYILLGVSLFTQAGLTAGIFYLLHHMVVKASLFLSTGAVEVRYGTGSLAALSGIARREPVIAAAFLVAALSLAGMPPFSGFVAKLWLIVAALEVDRFAAVGVMLLVSLLTLVSMLKIWSGVFWGSPPPVLECSTTESPADDLPMGGMPVDEGRPGTAAVAAGPVATTTVPVRAAASGTSSWLVAPGVALATITVALGLGAELLLSLSSIAAAGLQDPSTYIEAVLGS